MTIDRRLALRASATPADCVSGKPLPGVAVDFAAESPAQEDLVSLRAGEWFGRELSFMLFLDDAGPEHVCFEVFYSRPGQTGGPEAVVRGSATRTSAK